MPPWKFSTLQVCTTTVLKCHKREKHRTVIELASGISLLRIKQLGKTSNQNFQIQITMIIIIIKSSIDLIWMIQIIKWFGFDDNHQIQITIFPNHYDLKGWAKSWIKCYLVSLAEVNENLTGDAEDDQMPDGMRCWHGLGGGGRPGGAASCSYTWSHRCDSWWEWRSPEGDHFSRDKQWVSPIRQLSLSSLLSLTRNWWKRFKSK